MSRMDKKKIYKERLSEDGGRLLYYRIPLRIWYQIVKEMWGVEMGLKVAVKAALQ